MLGGLIDQSMDASSPGPELGSGLGLGGASFPPFLSQVSPLRIVYMYMPSYTVYAVGYVMKPVEYMKGENFTENRGETRPHPGVRTYVRSSQPLF